LVRPDKVALEESRRDWKFRFLSEKASSMRQEDLRDMFIKASNSVCTSTIVVAPDSLSPTPSTSSTLKIPENTEEDSVDCEPADGDIQMEYSSD
jgi:hypothetical protein